MRLSFGWGREEEGASEGSLTIDKSIAIEDPFQRVFLHFYALS
jgi:hypothetical protein